MTWGEFKARVESEGVTDETPILYIDFDEEPVAVQLESLGLVVS